MNLDDDVCVVRINRPSGVAKRKGPLGVLSSAPGWETPSGAPSLEAFNYASEVIS